MSEWPFSDRTEPVKPPSPPPQRDPSSREWDGASRGLLLDDDTLYEIRRRVGMVFQDPNDQLFMPTVYDDVAFGPANLGLSGAELDDRVTEAWPLSMPPRPLNVLRITSVVANDAGVAIATVLAMNPDVLVLDEPASDLDPASRRELIETLQGLEVAQLVVTHDLPLALELCSRTLIMDGGRVVADGLTKDSWQMRHCWVDIGWNFRLGSMESRTDSLPRWHEATTVARITRMGWRPARCHVTGSPDWQRLCSWRAAQGGNGADNEILVSAAASLTDALAEMEAAFEAEHPGVDVVLNLGGSVTFGSRSSLARRSTSSPRRTR